ncbi:replication factor C small subunit [Candidatus Woesearchaeota archaeon]|nr:replication factor C small subunit [Candidatus Woesearchaeota archaeon]
MNDLMIWTEKYRPSRFSEIVGQYMIVERVHAFVKNKNMPNLLFSGPAGVGKSSLALVIAKELYGPSWRENFLEMNASDSRGIDVVRNIIKDFARTKAIGNVPYKIIFLDEADALTREAQQALRRTMENYTNNTRFLLSCNYSSKIIDPILSRCTVFRFKPLSKDNFSEIIKKICKNEKLKIADKAIEALFLISEGDARKMENVLQSCAAISQSINGKLIYDIVSLAEPKEIREVLSIARKDFLRARNKLLDVMLNHGLSGIDVIKQISKEIWNLDINDERKIMLIDKCGEIEFRMVEGSDEFIQLEALLSNFLEK